MTKIGEMDLVHAILCEDVRQDKQNKYMIIGMFTGNIIVTELPVQVQLAIFLQMNGRGGPHPLFLRLSGPGEDSVVLETGITFDDNIGTATMNTPRLDVHMEVEGMFRVDLSVDQETWVPAIEKKVVLGPIPTS